MQRTEIEIFTFAKYKYWTMDWGYQRYKYSFVRVMQYVHGIKGVGSVSPVQSWPRILV
jgi:hypothetical protein